jgi:carbamoyl-phosphate synthase large subunit
VVNTPAGRTSTVDDSYIRKTAIQYRVPYITTVAAASATVKGLAAAKKGAGEIRYLQDYNR